MTRIVLLLTAIPLAAVLALVLNTLLDRRFAALETSARQKPGSALQRGLSIALALALSMTAAPALAESSSPPCSSIDCSLLVDADRVERLWESGSVEGAVLVTQSRIPVAFDADPEQWDGESNDVVAEEERPQRRPKAVGASPTTKR